MFSGDAVVLEFGLSGVWCGALGVLCVVLVRCVGLRLGGG